jgi:hypothetical protein
LYHGSLRVVQPNPLTRTFPSMNVEAHSCPLCASSGNMALTQPGASEVSRRHGFNSSACLVSHFRSTHLTQLTHFPQCSVAVKPYLRHPTGLKILHNIFLCRTSRPTDVPSVGSPQSEDQCWRWPAEVLIVSCVTASDIPLLIVKRWFSLTRTRTCPPSDQLHIAKSLPSPHSRRIILTSPTLLAMTPLGSGRPTRLSPLLHIRGISPARLCWRT